MRVLFALIAVINVCFAMTGEFQGSSQGRANQPFDLRQAIRNQLEYAISENELYKFYPSSDQARIESMVSRLEKVDFNRLARLFKVPFKTAIELSSLALYNIVVPIDDSFSNTADPYQHRLESSSILPFVLNMLTSATSILDVAPVQVRLLNQPDHPMKQVRNHHEVREFIKHADIWGRTLMDSSLLEQVISPMQCENKPLLVISLVRSPPSEEGFVNWVKEFTESARGNGRPIAFEFVQMGRDYPTAAFLRQLAASAGVHVTVHMIQETRRYVGVPMNESKWLLKLLMGSIDGAFRY